VEIDPEEEWDEDHALDQVLNNMVDDLEDEALITETEAELGLAEAELGLAEAELKEAEFDEEKNKYVLKPSIEDPVVGMSETVKEPVKKKTIIDRIVGFAEPVIENRFVKKTKEQIEQEEEEERLSKGPLFRYRTSKRDIEIDD
jgi:hypothetical protein